MNEMKTIGIIGGGQLGLMIAQQAHLLGARVVCLDPAADAPAFACCDDRIVGRFDDPQAVEELCRRADVVTYEFENVPGDLLVLSSKNTISNKGSGLCSTRRIACGRRAMPAIMD